MATSKNTHTGSPLVASFSRLGMEEQGRLLEELQAIHEQSRQAKRDELIAELEKLGGLPPAARASQMAGGRKRVSPAPAFRSPDGSNTWSGRGAIPRWAKALGVKDKSGMGKYRIK